MTNMRQVTLAVVIVSGVIGALVKLSTGSFMPPDDYVIDLSKVPEKIGAFVVQGEQNKDGALQLRLAQCDGSIFMGASLVKQAPPEALSAFLYPEDKWRTLYVYQAQTLDSFARIPAYLRLVALRLVDALTISAHDVSLEYFFSFYIPRACTVDPQVAVAASNAVLALATPGRL